MTGENGGPHGAKSPSPWVARFLPLVAPGGLILDVACGSGRHTRLALQEGYRVVAIDRTLECARDLAGRPDLELIEADLEGGADLPFAGRRYDGVIVTNYLWRPLLPALVAASGPRAFSSTRRSRAARSASASRPTPTSCSARAS